MSDYNSGKSSVATKLNSVLLTVVVALAAWNLQTTHSLELKVQEIQANSRNRWSSAHQQIWAGRLKERNPTLNIPDPLETIKSIE